MSDQAVQLLVGALVTIASQYIGYLALAKKLANKAEQVDLDDLEERVHLIENVHGGIVR